MRERVNADLICQCSGCQTWARENNAQVDAELRQKRNRTLLIVIGTLVGLSAMIALSGCQAREGGRATVAPAEGPGFEKGSQRIGVYEDKEHGVICYRTEPSFSYRGVAISCVKVAP